MKPPPSPQPDEHKKNEKRENLVKQFRAFLHLVITAQQTNQADKLKKLAGPGMFAYCRELAELPDSPLAVELSNPVIAILNQISDLSSGLEELLRLKDEEAVSRHASAKRILDELDFALAFVLDDLRFVKDRAKVTQCSELLFEGLMMDIGNGVEAANLIRRWQRLFPEGERDQDGSPLPQNIPDCFAWDVYQRVEALDELADEFPDHIRTAARQMHAWPMLVHRHTKNRSRFEQLAQRLELGADYPTDVTAAARFRPDTPLIRYLTPLIYRLNVVCVLTRDRKFKSINEEQRFLYMIWWTRREDIPGEDELAAINAARQLPPLTKATAKLWAEKAIVPYILATDAVDYANCDEPAFQQIAKQRGVKSKATFKSRLLAAVTTTLRRLARPA
jgi:hypothetical protein